MNQRPITSIMFQGAYRGVYTTCVSRMSGTRITGIRLVSSAFHEG